MTGNTNGRVLLLAKATLVLAALLAGCSLFYKKPWTNPEQRATFMLTMGAKFLTPTPVPNHCIDQLKRELKLSGAGAAARAEHSRRDAFSDALHAGMCAPASEPTTPTKANIAQCSEALRGCGNCHLPRVNNCNYRVTESGRSSSEGGRVYVGQITAVGPSTLTISAPEHSESRGGTIALDKIAAIEWLNGADPLSTWWDFKRLSPRGQMARRMFHLAETHKVGCTNCHMGHGDFRFTPEGEHFKKTGEVIRKVPLEEFLRARPAATPSPS